MNEQNLPWTLVFLQLSEYLCHVCRPDVRAQKPAVTCLLPVGRLVGILPSCHQLLFLHEHGSFETL